MIQKEGERTSGTVKPDSTARLLAICGVIGPILFTTLALVAAFLRPGYSHVTQTISELGFGPNAIVQNINFVVFGLLTIAFAFGLHRGLDKGRGSKIGPVLVAILGAGMVGSAIFPGDPSMPFSNQMHSLFGGIASIAVVLAPLLLWRRLKRNDRWKGYRSYSLVTGILTAVILLVIPVILFQLSLQFGVGGGFAASQGLWQRLLLAAPLLWIEVMGIRLLRVSIRQPMLAA